MGERCFHILRLNTDSETKKALKGPKLEIFGSRVFPQIRPVCVGDLGTRRKNSKF
jgi:hypothetical protein